MRCTPGGAGLLRWVVAGAAGLALTAAGVHALSDSSGSSVVTVAGLLVTFLLVRMPVALTRRGAAVEAQDMVEAPAVALALLLPPGQALLAFAGGVVIGELLTRQSGVKRLFNISLIVLGGALVVGAVALADLLAPSSGARLVAAAGGAAAGAFVSYVAVAAVVAAVQGARPQVQSPALERAGRFVVLATSVTLGLVVAHLYPREPVAVVALLAPLALLALTTRSGLAAQGDRERLQQVVALTNELQDAPTGQDREAAVVLAGQALFGLRHVEVRASAPVTGEFGRPLTTESGTRWLVVAPRPESDPWHLQDERVLDALGVVANQGLQRAGLKERLAEQALRDPLTGIANRRGVEERLDQLLLAAAGGVAVLLIDLDGFKEVNDSLGHEGGDEVLGRTAARLAGLTGRQDELVGRLGGDEFVVGLPFCGEAALSTFVRTLRGRLEEPMVVAGREVRVGVSLGAATSPDDGESRSQLLAAADRRMYDDKQAGRAAAQPERFAAG